MTTEDKTFPQTELEEEIYKFWRIRGWSEVTAILGNLNVSFHKDNPEYESLGLDYIYLKQFYELAQEKARKEFIKKGENIFKTYFFGISTLAGQYRQEGAIMFFKELQKQSEVKHE